MRKMRLSAERDRENEAKLVIAIVAIVTFVVSIGFRYTLVTKQVTRLVRSTVAVQCVMACIAQDMSLVFTSDQLAAAHAATTHRCTVNKDKRAPQNVLANPTRSRHLFNRVWDICVGCAVVGQPSVSSPLSFVLSRRRPSNPRRYPHPPCWLPTLPATPHALSTITRTVTALGRGSRCSSWFARRSLNLL